MALSAEQLKELRQTLEARRAELMVEISQDVSKLDEDSGVGEVRDTGDDSVAQLFADVDRADLQRDTSEVRELNAALARMDEGEYGTCVDCGSEIGLQRLRAQPTAMRDVRCQTIYEKTFAQPGRARL